MTRSQFLIVFYKKLLIPVLIITVAWAAWLGVTFITDTITSVDGSSFNFEGIFWFIVPIAVFIFALVLLRGVLNKMAHFFSAKTGIDTGKDSKAMKILGRVVDISIGAFIAYLWQTDKTKAFTVLIIYLQNFIREEFPNEKEAKE